MSKNSSFLLDIGEAITPLDGRNRFKLTKFKDYFSDFVLTKNRVKIEIKYLIKLSEYGVIRKLTSKELTSIEHLAEKFAFNDYVTVREIEKKTNHEAKAVEEYLRIRLQKTSLKDVSEMIHFGLTSDDINNLSYAVMIKNIIEEIFSPELLLITKKLKSMATKYKSLSMLSRTHGQPAAPTTLGKEFLIYYKRLDKELHDLRRLKIKAKLTGNTGNLNAHKLIYPKINWLKFSSEFVRSFGLDEDLVTTQIEPYDNMIFIFQTISRINNILLGLSVDFWLYISFGYFKQKLITTEVGSTALPHKINPIYFEGAEGGFGIANALYEFYSRKLSYSRLQRDLSDSTVRRSFGIAFAYTLLSYQSIREALDRIEADKEKIKADLETHQEVLSEAIQNFLRSKNHENAYNETKKFFRGEKKTRQEIENFIKKLQLKKEDESLLINLLPSDYTGYAQELVSQYGK